MQQNKPNCLKNPVRIDLILFPGKNKTVSILLGFQAFGRSMGPSSARAAACPCPRRQRCRCSRHARGCTASELCSGFASPSRAKCDLG